MEFEKFGIKVEIFGGFWAAVIRSNVRNRAEIKDLISQLAQEIPPDQIAGPPFWIRNFIHSYTDGFDVEVGFPLSSPLEFGWIGSRQIPEYEVLAKKHSDDFDTLGTTYADLFKCRETHGLISDEFCVEILHDGDPLGGSIEVMSVLHPWDKLFSDAVERELGEPALRQVAPRANMIDLDSSCSERFAWVKASVDRLDQIASDQEIYEVLSSCSHVFPREQAEKMRTVFLQELDKGADLLVAVDAVVAFMEADPGWMPIIYRDGRTLFSAKNPRDQEAYQSASTDLERRQAYCYCPLVRKNLLEGMSPSFCNCSAGFERKQWEVALGQPLRIEVVKSILKGDHECQFAIHLPDASLS